MDFPQTVSFTITNACNLRCQMCGQWSEEGYMRARPDPCHNELGLADWKKLVDEMAAHGLGSLLLRGGEPFMFPGIVELLEYIHERGLFISIDTNGTLLERFAPDIVRLGKMHLTVSMDGPEEIHDQVRGVKGTFQKAKKGLARLQELAAAQGQTIGQSLNFTISRYSFRGLGQMAEVARSLNVATVCIVPYYYVPEQLGQAYEKELQTNFGCPAFSWRGFHHEDSGVDFDEFLRQHRQYRATLGDIQDYPYLPLSEAEYKTWFGDALTPVRATRCGNVEKLIDIQPDGQANFCVDYPDYSLGNVRQATLAELWNGERAQRFREYRRRQPLSVCHRCGAKYMAEPGG